MPILPPLALAPDLPARLPVTVLTGFLGSGKTTLLNRLLREPGMDGSAVLINEFGAVGIDHDLVEHTEENMVLLSNGCICCTIRGDLVQALENLAAQARAQPQRITRVLLETTGLADPAPILHTLMGDARVTRNWALAGVACTIDACQAMATFDHSPESVKQAAVADLFLLTKTDLPEYTRPDALRERLHALNPVAVINADAAQSVARLRELIATGAGRADQDSAATIDEGAGAYRPFSSQLVGDTQDVNRHDDHVRSFCIVRETPLSTSGFYTWLEMITKMRGNDLLRVKGLVQLDDDPERPLVIHGVQHLFHPPERLARWPSQDRRTRIVFITRDIDADPIESLLRVYERRRPRPAA